MLEIEKPNITITEMSEDGTHGTFVVDPLERGYGITLGTDVSPRCRTGSGSECTAADTFSRSCSDA